MVDRQDGTPVPPGEIEDGTHFHTELRSTSISGDRQRDLWYREMQGGGNNLDGMAIWMIFSQ